MQKLTEDEQKDSDISHDHAELKKKIRPQNNFKQEVLVYLKTVGTSKVYLLYIKY